jgi:hypothetical protein
MRDILMASVLDDEANVVLLREFDCVHHVLDRRYVDGIFWVCSEDALPVWTKEGVAAVVSIDKLLKCRRAWQTN